MKRLIILPFVLLALGTASGADIKSGLEVGDTAGFFKVKDCTGPNLDKNICYR